MVAKEDFPESSPGGEGTGEVLVVFFSWTGTVEKVARRLACLLADQGQVVRLSRLEPRRGHGYWGWLLRSFLPGWKAPLRCAPFDLRAYQAVCLGFPKWSLSCPPLNEFLSRMQVRPGQPFGLFMCYGGFDEKRYFRGVQRRVEAEGAVVQARLLLRRRLVLEGRIQKPLQEFADRILSSRTPPA